MLAAPRSPDRILDDSRESRAQLAGAVRTAALLRSKMKSMERDEIAALRRAKKKNSIFRVVDRITDGFLVVDRQWHLLYINPSARALLRSLDVRKPSSSDLSDGMNLWLRWPDLANSQLYRDLHRAFALEKSLGVQQFVPQLGRWLEVLAYPDQEGMTLLLRDITTHKEYELQLAGQYAVTAVLEGAPSLRQAVAQILSILLRDERWQAGIFWKTDAAAKVLRCYELCQQSSDETAADFEAACRRACLAPWQGCPGRCWARGTPVWMQIGKDDDANRIAAARRRGVHFNFCFPIRIQHDIIGVIELAARDSRDPGPEMALAMEAVGVQIGRFMERRHKDLQLRRRLVELEAVYETADAAGRLGALAEICEAALNAVERGLKANRGAVLLLDADGALRVSAARGLSEDFRAALEANPGWLREADNAKPTFIGNVGRSPGPAVLRSALLAEGIRAVALAPLVGTSRLLGTLLLGYNTPLRFRQRHLRLANALASHIAVAVERGLMEEQRARLLQGEQIARFAAEQANRTKDQFLAIVSHELRTPLTAMLGYSRLLRTGRLDQPMMEMAIETIERNARLQAQMIEDLLDHSRLLTGKVHLEEHPIELGGVVQSTVDLLRPSAEGKNLSVTVMGPCEPLLVFGDPQRLQQVVSNLLSNAIKFTPDFGRIDVTLSLSDSRVHVEIRDTGIGISPEFLPHVFDMFRQADPSSSRTEGGLGLGLALVKQLVELHGGSVRAESPGLGQGTAFHVELEMCPDVLATGVEPVAESDAALDGVRILAVDDNEDTRQFLALCLERFGASVAIADSARQAMEVLESFQPQVLISDLAMPHEDGHALIRKIREREGGDRPRLPAVALSAFAREEDQRNALQSGFDVHVAKPVQPAALATAVSRLLKKLG